MYKVGDKVRLLSADNIDIHRGMHNGDIYTVTFTHEKDNHVFVNFRENTSTVLYKKQIELVQLSPPTHFNFISKTQIAEHLQKVITFYEDYTSDLLKETARDYREDIIDLKETGYEYRLELDKILIQVE